MLKDECIGVLSAQTEVLPSGRREVEQTVSQMDAQGAGPSVCDFQGQENERHIVHRHERGSPGFDPEGRGRLKMTRGEEKEGKGREKKAPPKEEP